MSPPDVHHLMDSRAGYGPVRNLFAVGDPDVCRISDRWVMLLGGGAVSGSGFDGVNLYSAQLPPGAPLDSDEWSFVTDPDDPTLAAPLVEPPGTGHFDEWLHTPCRVVGRVPGSDQPVERLFYTGSSGDPEDFSTRAMAIGVLERRDGRWARTRDEPILVGSGDRPCVLEPKAVYAEGRWRVWMQATHHEAGAGELPDCEIWYSESVDGVHDWTEPTVVFSSTENWFDAAVTELPDRFHALAARAPNLVTPVEGLHPQGLWSLTSTRPTGHRPDWTAEPMLLLDAAAGESWYVGGTYGPCAVVDTAGSGEPVLQVFFTGATVPDPSGYGMSIGRFAVPLTALPAPGA